MVLIVAHHYAVHSGFDFPVASITINRLWIQFLQLGGKIGVNIFVLISGYFLIDSNSFKINKILKLWGGVIFYSYILLILSTIFSADPFNAKEIIKSISPIVFSKWWFASTYFMLFLLSPYLNKLLKSLNKKEYLNCLFLLFLCWCIIPTFTGQAFQSNQLLWFIFVYSVAGFYRNYCMDLKVSLLKCVCTSICLMFLTFLSCFLLDVISIKLNVIGEYATFFYGMEKVPIFLASLFLFIGFSKINIKNNKFINVLSSATFGVYLIHDNYYTRIFIWQTLFRNTGYIDSNFLIPQSLFAIFSVYVVCTLIELIRIYFIENKCIDFFNKLAIFIDEFKNKLLHKLDYLFMK